MTNRSKRKIPRYSKDPQFRAFATRMYLRNNRERIDANDEPYKNFYAYFKANYDFILKEYTKEKKRNMETENERSN